MKKMLKSLMAAIGVALLMTGSVFAATTVTIGDEEALKAFAAAVNSGTSYEGDTVTLSADLDLTGVEWTPIGVGTRSSKSYTGKAFKGIFDGGNHTISGLTITSTDSDDAAVGLFGVVDGGTVKNLKLDAVNINVASSDLAGGAIGLMVNNAKAENITVGGSIVGNDGVGGIAGRLIISGTISSCTNNASVTSSYGGIGGIVGKAYYENGADTALFASVNKCVNNGTITAPMYVGGIVGLARANVIGCINNGVVVGGTQTGGIVGQLIAAGTVSNNENNAKISGKNHLGGIIGDYSQSNAYTYYNVTIADNINRGELAATEQRAAILGCNNIDGFTAMTASGNVSFYNAEGLELFGNPEDMVIDQTNMFNPAAKIGDTPYATLADAFAAVKNGETITLLSDLTILGETFTIADGKTITLDMNGKKITATDNKAANVSYELFYIYGGLTVTGNGAIELTSTSNDTAWAKSSTIFHNRGGVLTITNGTFKHLGGTAMAFVVDNNANSFGDAKLYVKGGEIISQNYIAVRMRMETPGAYGHGVSYMTVTGGYIYGASRGIWGQKSSGGNGKQGELTVTGGTIENNNTSRGAIQIDTDSYESQNMLVSVSGTAVIKGALMGGNDEFAVSGGSFTVAVPEEFCAEGFEPKQNSDGTYGVVVNPAYGKVAKIGDEYYATLLEALQAAANIESTETVVVQLLGDTREVMPTDIELLIKSNVSIVSASGNPVAAKFYNNGTSYDFIFNSATGFEGKTLTIGENVTFQLEDRIIWAGYYGNNVKVVVDGVLAGFQYWHGADTTVNATGLLKTTGEALVMRRGATMTINEGKVEANYFNILAGNIVANNATITSGAIWVANTGSYDNEGGVSIDLTNTQWTSSGNLKLASEKTATLKLTNSDLSIVDFDGYGASQIDANSTIIVDNASELTFKTLTGAGSIAIDITGMSAGELNVVKGNLGGFTGEITTVGNDGLTTEIQDGKLVLVERTLVGTGTEADPFVIASLADLELFRDMVNDGTTFDNQFVKLTDDINLNSVAWTPIGNATAKFLGTFDGSGKTISNLVVDSNANNAGLFGFASVIKNLTISNAKVEGVVCVGAMVGELESSVGTLDNCHVTGRIEVTGENSVGGLAGKGYANIRNSSVIGDGVATSFVLGIYGTTEEGDNVGGLIGHLGEGNTLGVADSTVKNIKVVGTRKIGGLVGTTARANDYVGNTVENVTVESSATAEYADNNASTCTIGGIIGNYFGSATSGGILKDSTVKDVTFVIGNAKSAGALVGGDRVNNGGEPVGVEASGSVVENITGATQQYLMPKVAQVGTTKYVTLAEAAAAAKAGDEIVLLADAAEDVTVPAGVVFNGNGKQVGVITAAGTITFKGVTKATNFGVQYTNTEINIGEGACLEITGTGRLVVGHGCTFNITGTIADAKTADKATLTPSLIAPGASFTGAGVTFNANNAYVKFTAYCSSKNSNASGIYNINVTNSIWEQTGSLVFSEPTNGMDPTFNFNLKDSVLDSTSHLVFAVTKGEIVFDNSNVNVDVYRQLENRSTLTIKNGSVVYAAHATSSNAKNPGTTIVENATYVATGDFSGSDVGTGTLIVKKGASVTMGKITGANVVVDATDMVAGDVIDLDANLSTMTGTLEVINNDKLEASIVDGKIVLAAKPVAKIGDVTYATLQAAIDAAQSGETIVVLTDIALAAGVVIASDDVITIDLNGKTISMVYAQDATANHEMIHNYGNLTIQDTVGGGKLSYTYTGGSLGTTYAANTITSEPGSVLTVKSGTIENLTYDSAVIAYAIDGRTNGGAGDVAVNIEGGTITSLRQSIRIFANSTTNTGTLNISGGEMVGRVIVQNSNANANKAALNITGGTFNANSYKSDVLYVGGSNSATMDINASISGGTFNGEITETHVQGFISGGTFNSPVNGAYCGAGFIPVDNGNGTYGVKEGAYVAQINAVKYETLAAALAAAQEGDTVKLLADASVEGTAQIPAGVTIKSNGYKILGSIRMLGDLTLDGSLEITGGLWVGKAGETLAATLAGDKLTASYFMFQRGSYTIDADIDAVYGYLSFEGEFEVNSTITTSNTNGEPLYLRGQINLNEGASFIVKNLFLDNANTVLKVKKGASITAGSGVSLRTAGAQLYSSGDISGSISAIDGTTVSLTGGTYTQDVAEWCAEGYQSVKQPGEELWQVGKLPNAEVVNMGPTEVSPDSYFIFNITNGTHTSNHKDPFDLQITLNFIAKDSAEKAAENAYGDYITDFRIKIDGLSAASITADENCYLAGYYAGMWVKVNLKDFVIENGVGYPVISALFPFTYEDICRDVKNFICGIHLSDDVLNANPNLKVSLDLGLAETQNDMVNGTGFVQVGETYDYTADEMRNPVAITGPDYFMTVTGAVAAALETGDYVKLVNNAVLEEDLELGGDLVLNLGGKTLTAADKKLVITDSVVTITNGTLSGFSAANITLTGNAILTVTEESIAASFRSDDTYYVSQNANDTHSIMLRSAFRVFITVVDGEPRIGFFKDCSGSAPTYTLLGATNLENPDWASVAYTQSDDASGASELPLYWVKLDQAADDTNVYRFFKIGSAPAAE